MKAWVVKKDKKYWSYDKQVYSNLNSAQIYHRRGDIGPLEPGEEVRPVKVNIEEA